MQAEIKQSQDERVAAQQALHELQLQMREVSVAAAQDSFQKSGRRDSLVSSRVLDMEDSTPGRQTYLPRVYTKERLNVFLYKSQLQFNCFHACAHAYCFNFNPYSANYLVYYTGKNFLHGSKHT